MERFAIKISKDELSKKLSYDEYGVDIGSLLSRTMKKDLSEVDFDTENCDSEGKDGLIGLNTLENGLTFCGFLAGGDWENPIFFIIYYDGISLRGYIPENGNTFNKYFRCAYGSLSHSDKYKELGEKESLKIVKKELKERLPYELHSAIDRIEYEEDAMSFDLINWDEIKKDIEGKILVKE